MTEIVSWLRDLVSSDSEVQVKLAASFLVVMLCWFVHRVVTRVVQRRTEDVQVRYRWRKTSSYSAIGFGLFFLGYVWIERFQSIGTFLGLLSAGLTIALRDLVAGLAGWVFLIVKRPFELGDRIQIGAHAGDVIDIRVFQFTLMEIGNWVDADQSTGRVIHVPNGRVLTEVLANYSKGFELIWHEIPVLVTFESDWRRAKEILQAVADKHAQDLGEETQERIRRAAKRFLILYNKLTPTVYTKVVDSGVLLTIRFLCEPRRRRGMEQAVWEDVLDAFGAEPGIDFAYPTQRFYDHPREAEQPAQRSGPA